MSGKLGTRIVRWTEYEGLCVFLFDSVINRWLVVQSVTPPLPPKQLGSAPTPPTTLRAEEAKQKIDGWIYIMHPKCVQVDRKVTQEAIEQILKILFEKRLELQDGSTSIEQWQAPIQRPNYCTGTNEHRSRLATLLMGSHHGGGQLLNSETFSTGKGRGEKVLVDKFQWKRNVKAREIIEIMTGIMHTRTRKLKHQKQWKKNFFC